jgi:hypothetical protein
VPTTIVVEPSAMPDEYGAAFGGRHLAGEQHDAEADLVAKRFQRLVVLAGEDFGGRHQRRLRAALGHRRHRHQRDDGLAGADIALQQA